MFNNPEYQYGLKPGKNNRRKFLIVLVCLVLFFGIIGGFVYADLRNQSKSSLAGKIRLLSQPENNKEGRTLIEEPNFKFDLPMDWKETSRNDKAIYTSINWQATKKGQENRYLTIYMDRIPIDMPINRLVTVTVHGNTLSYGDVSDNCANFTVGGTFDVNVAANLKPTITKWDKVDFICNLPGVIDNVVGTGSLGTVNSTEVTGPNKGLHKYFFVYTDRNLQPEYSIFYDVLSSFVAK